MGDERAIATTLMGHIQPRFKPARLSVMTHFMMFLLFLA